VSDLVMHGGFDVQHFEAQSADFIPDLVDSVVHGGDPLRLASIENK
jgi:hypothetical protein